MLTEMPPRSSSTHAQGERILFLEKHFLSFQTFSIALKGHGNFLGTAAPSVSVAQIVKPRAVVPKNLAPRLIRNAVDLKKRV